MKSCRIQTTGKSSSAWRNDQVVGPGKSGDGIQKNGYVFFMFYQTACTLHYHLRYTFMVLRKLIEGRVDNLYVISPDSFFYVCNLLRALIDQKDNQMHIRIVPLDRFGYIFQKCGLAGFRGRYDHSSLAFSDGADQVYDPHGYCSARAFHYQTLIGEDRCHILEIISFLPFTWVKSIDGCHI